MDITSKNTLETDVVVAGGGIAGIAAALAAARAGVRVTLVEREYLLGGLATLGLITIYLPLCDGEGRQICFGIAEELLRLAISQGAEASFPDAWLGESADPARRKTQRFMARYNPQLFALLAERLLLDAGVRILYGVQICGVETQDGRITNIQAMGRGDQFSLRAKSYVDATGDAFLLHQAGEKTRLFQQGNVLAAWYYSCSEGNISLHQLGACDVPEEYKRDNQPELLTQRRFAGLDTQELSEMTQLAHECILKDVLSRKSLAPSAVPVTVPTIPQVRMTRCLEGMCVPDDKSPHTYVASSIGMIPDWRKRGPVFELPFEMLHGAKVANLYAAGRCVSVTDSMWDITRVIPPCAVTGQAAGQAAAMQAASGAQPDLQSLQIALESAGVRLHEQDL